MVDRDQRDRGRCKINYLWASWPSWYILHPRYRDIHLKCAPLWMYARVYQSSRICRASRGERKTGQEFRTVSPRRRRSGWNNLPCLAEEKFAFSLLPSPCSLCACIFSHSRPISYRRVITRREHAPCILPEVSLTGIEIEKLASGESWDSLSYTISISSVAFSIAL